VFRFVTKSPVMTDRLPPDALDRGSQDYGVFLADAKRRIEAARARAARAVSAELIGVYWYLGRGILAPPGAEGLRLGARLRG
jgi:hypothetical protein